MFSINIPSFTVCRSKIARGRLILNPHENKRIDTTKINKTTTNCCFLTKIQSYHKSWKRKESLSSSSPPSISTLLYKYKDPGLDKRLLLVHIDLLSEFIAEIYVNDDLTTYDVLTNCQKIIISNLLLFTCPVCLDVKSVYFIQSCGHCLCKSCLEGLVATTMGQTQNTCIVCRRKNNEGYW